MVSKFIVSHDTACTRPNKHEALFANTYTPFNFFLSFPLPLSSLLKVMFRFRMALQRVFVYGTLKRGQPNYHLLVDPKNGVAKFLGEAKLTTRYPLVVGSSFGVPLLLPVENQGKVRGTI